MTLRLRLVIALLVLTTVGLGIFGVVTYSLYSRSQYERVDDLLRNSQQLVARQLRVAAGLDENTFPRPGFGTDQTGPAGSGGAGGVGGGQPRGDPPVLVPPGTYAELRDSSGNLVMAVQLSQSSQKPDLPKDIKPDETFQTVGSVEGSTQWRVYATDADRPPGDTVVVAIPLNDVTASLHRLILLEVTAGAGLLVLLAAGSWFILRRGLRPLEQMADSARTITAGDLSERVSPADGHTEVGQLGLALNTMLSEIEEAFTERDATEQRLRQFLADASHELRTPLTSIQGFAELFRLGADEDRMQLAVIFRRIEEESARMKTLVEDLLLLARVDETRPTQRLPVDLAVLAADACSDAVAISPGRPVTLNAPEPVIVNGDRDHLRQAIANLVTNAVSHTAEGLRSRWAQPSERDTR